MVYYAKVDGWLAALIGGGAVAELVAGAVVLVAGLTTGTHDLLLLVGIASALVAVGVFMGLMFWGLYETRYEVASPDLIVRFGPFRTRVALDSIVEVFPTRNPLSAPAPSLDRLRINYRKKNGKVTFALISPKDKEGFVRDLASAAPQLRDIGAGPLRLTAEEPA